MSSSTEAIQLVGLPVDVSDLLVRLAKERDGSKSEVTPEAIAAGIVATYATRANALQWGVEVPLGLPANVDVTSLAPLNPLDYANLQLLANRCGKSMADTAADILRVYVAEVRLMSQKTVRGY